MEMETIYGIVAIIVIMIGYNKFLAPPRPGQQSRRGRKDKYLLRIEEELTKSVEKFFVGKAKQVKGRYGIVAEISKIEFSLEYEEDDPDGNEK